MSHRIGSLVRTWSARLAASAVPDPELSVRHIMGAVLAPGIGRQVRCCCFHKISFHQTHQLYSTDSRPVDTTCSPALETRTLSASQFNRFSFLCLRRLQRYSYQLLSFYLSSNGGAPSATSELIIMLTIYINSTIKRAECNSGIYHLPLQMACAVPCGTLGFSNNQSAHGSASTDPKTGDRGQSQYTMVTMSTLSRSN